MKKFAFFLAFAAVIVFSDNAQAFLEVRGLGTIVSGGEGSGGQYLLIYDKELDITWLDLTKSPHTWDAQKTWASELVVEFDGQTYNGWRLPSTVDVPGPYVYGYDGTTTAGWNITTSEMGHLFYTELGNKGFYDKNGNALPDFGLQNIDPFLNLQSAFYWSGTEYSQDPTNQAWDFRFEGGDQAADGKGASLYALAVRDGDVARVKYDLIGREYFPGIIFRGTTIGAMFAGQVKNTEGVAIGQFNVITNHQGGPIEECGATNVLVYFKLTMNFFDGRRLVLLMPYGDTAEANWDWDDATCPYGGRECDFYSVENLVPCESDVNPEVSLVADVSNIPLTKRKFGSRGFDKISGGVLNGWLIHTPPIFPAVIGTFVAN